MRRVVLSLASVAVFVTAAFSAQAQPADKYCLQGRHWGFPGNCQFATYRQCMATASGTNARCGINPRWAFARKRHHR